MIKLLYCVPWRAQLFRVDIERMRERGAPGVWARAGGAARLRRRDRHAQLRPQAADALAARRRRTAAPTATTTTTTARGSRPRAHWSRATIRRFMYCTSTLLFELSWMFMLTWHSYSTRICKSHNMKVSLAILRVCTVYSWNDCKYDPDWGDLAWRALPDGARAPQAANLSCQHSVCTAHLPSVNTLLKLVN